MTETRTCQNCKQAFTIEAEDFDFYKKMEVPPPTFCWLCRAQRRFAFRNERALAKRTSDFSNKEIFATYGPDAPFPVYGHDEWHSDAWDPLAYGQAYDFTRPFFEQYAELSAKVPRPSKSATGFLTNSDYSNNATDLKNCYLLFNAGYNEDCAYGNALRHCNFCFDNTDIEFVEFGYENFNLARCSRIFFSMGMPDSTNIWFSKNLRGCRDCFGCVNLTKKDHYIFNEPYSKEEYAKAIQTFDTGSYTALEDLKRRTAEFWLRFPVKFRKDGSKSVNVSGEYVFHSKNAHKAYQATGVEDVKYCQYVNYPPFKDSYDFTVYGENSERCYECAMVGEKAYGVKFSLQTYGGVRNAEYCEYCTSSSDLFGCISVRNKEYCILNKQYSKADYNALLPKIKKHMQEMPYVDAAGREYRYGEFFPMEFSPFGYNETIAQEHFPLTKESAVAQGYHWRDIESKNHTVTISWQELPDHIKDVNISVLQEVLSCRHEQECDHGCTGAFRVMPEELQFLQRFNIALPRLCVNCRHRERLKKRNSVHLWQRQCMCDYAAYQNTVKHQHHLEGPCPNTFETSYAPDRPEIVYCEQCYQQEVV